jgi:hypothetical protein
VKQHTGSLEFFLHHYPQYPSPGPSKLVGKAIIPLETLHDEQVHTTWFNIQELASEKKAVTGTQINLQLQYTFSAGTHLGAKIALSADNAFVKVRSRDLSI